MKAAIYIRVSTEEQSREGFSIPAQLKALRQYCKQNRIAIYDEYIDEGISGAKEDRPEFQRMLSDAKRSSFNAILVHKFDRFARKVELSQRIKNQLRKANINVISITEPIEDSPIGFFQEGMLELLGEYYIRNLSAEVKKGQKEKASQGYALNRVAYGYKNKGGKVEVVKSQAAIVQKIYNMYICGEGTTKIANWLNDNNVPTYTGIGIWNSSQITYILRNSTYIGNLKWGKKIYPDVFPAIIDKELFIKAQTQWQSAGPRPRRHIYYNQFLLLGLLYCGNCGSPMRISKMRSNGGKGSKEYFYYTCRLARYNKKECRFSKLYQYKLIEKQVINELKGILKEMPTHININELKPVNINDYLSDRKNKILSELERAKQAYLAEVFSLDEYKKVKEKLETDLKIIEFEEVKDDKNKSKLNREKLKNKIKNMWEQYQAANTPKQKKEALMEVVEKITVFETHTDIVFYV
ncbi:MAG: recombinase family protein [Deltaproteobacteria bacterium]|nr:recombinase family protein [Deltaproteobacteria bacterium]